MRGPFAIFVMAPLIYGVFYPQPYLGQILRKIPIAVVDNDLSDLSRSIVQTLDASGAVSVVLRANTLAEGACRGRPRRGVRGGRYPARHRAGRA